MSYPKQCPKCGADWTNPANVRQWGTVGARWGGRVDEEGEWEDDGNGADVEWDACNVEDFMCRVCDGVFPVHHSIDRLEDY